MVLEIGLRVCEESNLRKKGKARRSRKSKVRGGRGKNRSRFLARVARSYKLCL